MYCIKLNTTNDCVVKKVTIMITEIIKDILDSFVILINTTKLQKKLFTFTV